jgi:hypothetical protein
VIVWLNGTFGVGKTAVAAELKRRLPDAPIFDPEAIGYLLGSVLPIPTGDFQDLRSWRRLVAVTALELHSQVPGLLIIPMTLLRQDYAQEILDQLQQQTIVRHLVLHADPEELQRRIQRDDPTPSHPELTARTRAWRLAHLERYGRARRRLATTAHAEIDTTTLPVQDIAALIIKQLGLR